MVVKNKYRLYLQRYKVVSKIGDKLRERQCICTFGYFVVKAVVSTNALTYSSENGKPTRSILSLGEWDYKLLAIIEPGLLLDHVSSEGSLIKVNDRMVAKDPVSELHGKFNSTCL